MAVQKLNVKTTVEHERVPYTQVSNHVIKNFKNMEAFCVWVYLLSMPSDWKIIKNQVKNHFGIGDTKVKKIFSCLSAHNLVRNEAIKDPKTNRIIEWKFTVLNGSEFIENINKINTNSTGSIFHRVETPPGGKRRTTNKDKQQINKKITKRGGSKSADNPKPKTFSLSDFKNKSFPFKESDLKVFEELGINEDMTFSKFISYQASKNKKKFNIDDLALWVKREIEYALKSKKSPKSPKSEIKCTVPFYENKNEISKEDRESAKTALKSIMVGLKKTGRVSTRR